MSTLDNVIEMMKQHNDLESFLADAFAIMADKKEQVTALIGFDEARRALRKAADRDDLESMFKHIAEAANHGYIIVQGIEDGTLEVRRYGGFKA